MSAGSGLVDPVLIGRSSRELRARAAAAGHMSAGTRVAAAVAAGPALRCDRRRRSSAGRAPARNEGVPGLESGRRLCRSSSPADTCSPPASSTTTSAATTLPAATPKKTTNRPRRPARNASATPSRCRSGRRIGLKRLLLSAPEQKRWGRATGCPPSPAGALSNRTKNKRSDSRKGAQQRRARSAESRIASRAVTDRYDLAGRCDNGPTLDGEHDRGTRRRFSHRSRFAGERKRR